MRHMLRLSAAACALVLGVAVLPAEDRKPGEDDKTPFTDQTFVAKAASDGLHEVELGKLAQSNGQSEDVKKFGERMVTDHTKSNMELKEIAKGAGIEVPSQIMPEHQKHIEQFSKLRGAAFDAQYGKHMVEDHQKAIALFERASREARNPELKGFATKSLPTLKEHLAMAQKLPGGQGGDRPNDK